MTVSISHLALLLACSPAGAATSLVVLDSFSTGNAPFTLTSVGSQSDEFGDASIAGGWRSIAATVSSNPFNRSAQFGVTTSTGQFFVELDAVVTATTTLTYDGLGSGLGAIDLTLGGADALGLAISDSDPGLTLGIRIEDSSGEVATGNLVVADAVTTLSDHFFVFSQLDNAAATDFTRVESVVFTMENGVAGDFTLAFVSTYNSIPEPSVVFLGLLSSVLLAGRRRAIN